SQLRAVGRTQLTHDASTPPSRPCALHVAAVRRSTSVYECGFGLVDVVVDRGPRRTTREHANVGRRRVGALCGAPPHGRSVVATPGCTSRRLGSRQLTSCPFGSVARRSTSQVT